MVVFERMNFFQIVGLIISLTGLLFMAFPTFIGVVAIRIITFIFLIIGLYSFTFALISGSKISIVASISVLLLSLYAFVSPENVLFMIGVGCIISGVNGVFIYLKSIGKSSEKAVISSIILILLGVFAIINAQAALTTVVMILGIMITIIGLVVFFLGKSLIIKKARSFYSTVNDQTTNMKEQRIIVNIDSDDVEEIDYSEVD